MNISKITKNDFLNYEQVRRFGGYDMLNFQAFQLTGMSRARYLVINEHYKYLYDKYRLELQKDEWSTK